VIAHDAQIFKPRAHRSLLLIPVLNEGERIRAQLQRIAALAPVCDIAIVDGGSTDGALELGVLESCGVRALLTKRAPGRLGTQLRIGYRWALDQGYLGVITVDGNGKDDVRAVPDFVDALERGFDFIQGSRYAPGGQAINTPWDRALAVRFLHAPLVSWRARFRFTDTTNGFRAVSARLLNDPRVDPWRPVFTDYALLFYLAVRAGQLGYRLAELPVTRAYPSGPVPTKIAGVRGKWLLLRELMDVVHGHYDP
jgi:dolichol-phosphate mannosyltransferase